MPFVECSREKKWLFPPTLDELVPQDHEVRFVAEFVEQVDLRNLGIEPAPASEGRPSYPPRMLLACWVYGFMVRVRSSRKMERACRERMPFMWLSGMTAPDHNTFWLFYKENRDGVRRILKETVVLARSLDLTSMVEHALDGSKIAGSAARSRTYDGEALQEMERKIEEQIADLERQNKEEEGKEERSGRLPQELAQAEALKAKVEEALQELGESGRGRVNLTDKDARLMKGPKGVEVCYNAQAMAEGKNRIIVGADVVNEENDIGQLLPMLEATAEGLGGNAERTVADAGYFSGENVAECERKGLQVVIPEPQSRRKADSPDWPYHKGHFEYRAEDDTYRCPEGKVLTFSHLTLERGKQVRVYRGRECEGCPARVECTRDRQGRTLTQHSYDWAVMAHREKMKSEAAQALSGLRKTIVEPVIGIIKEQLDGRRFLLRGLRNVRAEWALLCAGYNLWKIFRLWWRRRGSLAAWGAG